MIIPIVIFKDPDSSYGVVAPDIPGCFSAGDTVEEALANTQDAIESVVGDAAGIPQQVSTIEELQQNEAYRDAAFMLYDADFSFVQGKLMRVNISAPEHTLKKIDAYAKAHGMTRSGFLLRAARKEMGAQGS